MVENKHQDYTTPTVKVVAFTVEAGFAGSPVHAGDDDDQGTSKYIESQDGWSSATGNATRGDYF